MGKYRKVEGENLEEAYSEGRLWWKRTVYRKEDDSYVVPARKTVMEFSKEEMEEHGISVEGLPALADRVEYFLPDCLAITEMGWWLDGASMDPEGKLAAELAFGTALDSLEEEAGE